MVCDVCGKKRETSAIYSLLSENIYSKCFECVKNNAEPKQLIDSLLSIDEQFKFTVRVFNGSGYLSLGIAYPKDKFKGE